MALADPAAASEPATQWSRSFTVGLSRGWALYKAVRLGIAAGSAMLLTPGTAPCALRDVERLFEDVAEPV